MVYALIPNDTRSLSTYFSRPTIRPKTTTPTFSNRRSITPISSVPPTESTQKTVSNQALARRHGSMH